MKLFLKLKSKFLKVRNPFIFKYPVYIPVLQSELLKGRNIIITGGSSGIGFEIAKACILNGANILLVSRDRLKLSHAKELLIMTLKLSQDRINFYCLDISKPTDIDFFFKNIKTLFPGNTYDCLINNSSITSNDSFGHTSFSDFVKVTNTNIYGTYYMSECFSNYLIDSKYPGNILIISSVSGIRPSITPYMISKNHQISFTKGLAKRLIKNNIVVNGVAPGLANVGLLGKKENLYNSKSPSKRLIDGMEIANLAVFLISHLGKMIVGETVIISGGTGNLTFDDIVY
jgi:3-oxoacyl-[acyl-carrier protein] reductase